METTKSKLLSAINTVTPLPDYQPDHHIFSQDYGISSTAMVYILNQLSKDFRFPITEDFIDALDMCTFAKLEALLETHQDTLAS